MTKFRIISDIHSEFWDENFDKAQRMIDMILPPLDTDSETVLFLAGDTGSHRRRNIYAVVIEHLSKRFMEILDIPGNHFWYGADHGIEGCNLPNVASEKYIFGRNYSRHPVGWPPVHACVLWTDFNNENPIDMVHCMTGMNDYRQIPNHTPQLVLEHNRNDVEWLKSRVKPGDIVMTHHAPSLLSIAPQYKNSLLNAGCASNLDYLIEELRPSLWVHGHIHTPCDYTICDTRVICNPAGYLDEQQHKKDLVVEI